MWKWNLIYDCWDVIEINISHIWLVNGVMLGVLKFKEFPYFDRAYACLAVGMDVPMGEYFAMDFYSLSFYSLVDGEYFAVAVIWSFL